jgi:hypothetical protein
MKLARAKKGLALFQSEWWNDARDQLICSLTQAAWTNRNATERYAITGH